jgi:hypothetical protein
MKRYRGRSIFWDTAASHARVSSGDLAVLRAEPAFTCCEVVRQAARRQLVVAAPSDDLQARAFLRGGHSLYAASMGLGQQSAVHLPATVSEAPQSTARLREGASAPRRALRYAGIALCFLAAFWAFAGASDWFVDAPFHYTNHDEWSQNLIKSAARSMRREEAALFIVSLFTAFPAVLFVAWGLLGRAPRPLHVLERFAARSNLRFVALLAAIAAALAWFGFEFILHGAALIDDERSYLFAARNMASGTLFRASVPAAFRNPMVLTFPAWISKYTPGFAGILYPGVLLGLPRLMPSVVCGLSIFGMFQLAKSLFGLRTAVIASVFWAFSPFQLAINSTTMIFGSSSCLALWTAALVARGLRRGEQRAILGAALFSAVHVLVRPFDAALALGTLGLVIAAHASQRLALRYLAIIGGGFALGVVGVALFNVRVFGAPLSSG